MLSTRTLSAAVTAFVVLLLAPAAAGAAALNVKSVAGSLNDALTGSVEKVTRKGAVSDAIAGAVPKRDAECEAAVTEQPFLRWGDRAQYVPAPNGGFEDGLTGWEPRGKPAIVADNEPWRVTGRATDSKAVKLANGDAITIGGLCGGLAYPTIRLFAKSATALPAVGLVSVRYTGTDGLLYTLPLGPFVAGRTWQPTNLALTLSGLPLLTGTKLGLELTPLTGSIVLDDIYVDPMRRA